MSALWRSALIALTAAEAPVSVVMHGTCAIVGQVLAFFESGAVPVGEVDIDKLYDGASACTIRR